MNDVKGNGVNGQGGRVAIVDDEPNLRDTVSFALAKEGYDVVTYADGVEAWRGFQAAPPDLAILDILMPRMDGLDLCRRIRAENQSLPILFLTSRDEEFDRVLGLELGADDYLCKPFSMRELVARVRVLFRRVNSASRSTSPRSAKRSRSATSISTCSATRRAGGVTRCS